MLEKLNWSLNCSEHRVSALVHAAQESVAFCLYQIFAPSYKLYVPIGHIAVYLSL